MDVSFLTPFAGAFALTGLLPLGVFVLRRRRMSELRSALRLENPARGSRLTMALGLVAVPALLGVAATQPVVETTRIWPERTDAQVFVVLDTSRSMLAAAAAGKPTRLERARRVAAEVRAGLPQVPVGIASFTSGVLPHLFPTTNRAAFDATLRRAIGIGRTPTSNLFLTLATNLNSLADFARLNYFPPTARKRVLVVLTDGESQPLTSGVGVALRRGVRIQTVFVRFWDADERIYETGVAEGGYQPDQKSEALLARFASTVGGRVYSEDQASDVVGAVRDAVGKGPIVKRKQEAARVALMPYVTMLAFLPLVLVLLQRNVWWRGLPRVRGSRRVAVRASEGAKVSEPRGVAQPG